MDIIIIIDGTVILRITTKKHVRRSEICSEKHADRVVQVSCHITRHLLYMKRL